MNRPSTHKTLIALTTVLIASLISSFSYADSKSQGSFRPTESEDLFEYDRSVSSFGAQIETTPHNDLEPAGSMDSESSTFTTDLDLEFEFEELTVNDVTRRNRMKFTDASEIQRSPNDGLGVSLKKSKKSKN